MKMKKYKGISYFTGVEVVGNNTDQIGDRYFIEDEKTGNWVQVNDIEEV